MKQISGNSIPISDKKLDNILVQFCDKIPLIWGRRAKRIRQPNHKFVRAPRRGKRKEIGECVSIRR